MREDKAILEQFFKKEAVDAISTALNYDIDLMGMTPEDGRIEVTSNNEAALAGIRKARQNSARVYLDNPHYRAPYCRECCQDQEQCDCRGE